MHKQEIKEILSNENVPVETLEDLIRLVDKIFEWKKYDKISIEIPLYLWTLKRLLVD